ncbi:TrmH family RNA methyltransferase [Microbacterium immunditiarum]|uniref:TrmH family RNA methyltransferase n=1 Tax=Microbacterium immunditiarum TaxID=337480 RepID=A0A7Y9GLF1_9MICO|nr:TrmH family RNA methyltransferase [Microbacterium immunditiarum]
MRITTRNARFQVWQSLLANRKTRQREGEFIVQGVRPITLALEHGWDFRAVVFDESRTLSRWAAGILERTPSARHVAMSPELIAELGEKSEGAPELVAVVAMRPDALDRIATGEQQLTVVFDRPTQPGNIGSLVRSADAFGATGVIVTGHAADVYDPKSVRASTGSLFAVPTIRIPSPRGVVEWADRLDSRPLLVGTDESGDVDIDDHDFRGPHVVLVGNETSGLSTAWREAADLMVCIPMVGSASSLNAANAATAVLYEAARQRRRHAGGPPAG